MSFEILVGLNVEQEEIYSQYREAMTPILKSYGGSFRYDFKVAEVLRSRSDHMINRVFTIRFPNQQAKEDFFADPAYLNVRQKFFDDAVDGVTTIAEFNAKPPQDLDLQQFAQAAVS